MVLTHGMERCFGERGMAGGVATLRCGGHQQRGSVFIRGGIRACGERDDGCVVPIVVVGAITLPPSHPSPCKGEGVTPRLRWCYLYFLHLRKSRLALRALYRYATCAAGRPYCMARQGSWIASLSISFLPDIALRKLSGRMSVQTSRI